jgi:hypothetical protein
MPTKNTITNLFVSWCALSPHSFASYLGHCSSCIMLLCMTFHTNNSVSNTQELHCKRAKNPSIICISFIHLSWTFPVFSFSTKYFCRSYLAFPLQLEESININSGVNHLTHSPKDISQILIALDFTLLRWIIIII